MSPLIEDEPDCVVRPCCGIHTPHANTQRDALARAECHGGVTPWPLAWKRLVPRMNLITYTDLRDSSRLLANSDQARVVGLEIVTMYVCIARLRCGDWCDNEHP